MPLTTYFKFIKIGQTFSDDNYGINMENNLCNKTFADTLNEIFNKYYVGFFYLSRMDKTGNDGYLT